VRRTVLLGLVGTLALAVGVQGLTGAAVAGWAGPLSRGQRLYVPVYSSVRLLEGRTMLNLAVTVSVRNTDAARPIRVEAVRYFGNDGGERGDAFAAPGVLGPMASAEMVIRQSELVGDIGANLIVEWRSDGPVSPPLVEAVMVGISGTQGFAFASRAVILDEWR
jgi:hypothetical protein